MKNYKKTPSQILNSVVDKGFLPQITSPRQIEIDLHAFDYSEETLDRILDEAFESDFGFEQGEYALKLNFIVLALGFLYDVKQAKSSSVSVTEFNRAMALSFQMKNIMDAIFDGQVSDPIVLDVKLAEGHSEPKKLAEPRRKTTKLKQIEQFVKDSVLPRKELIKTVSDEFGVTTGSAAVYVSRFL